MVPGSSGGNRDIMARIKQIVCALRFFYGVTLSHRTIPERIAYAREPGKLPVRTRRRLVALRRGCQLPRRSRAISVSASALNPGNRSAAAAASGLEESRAPSKMLSDFPGPEHSGNAT